MDKDQKITKAEYYNDYKLLVSFSDGESNIFDFKNLVTSERKEYMPYLDITKFKKFKIQRKVNCIAWGKENNMQIPGFILYSAKKSSIGWYKNETAAELKKRLPKRHYYEAFVDNNIWAGIHVLLGLLNGDKNAGLFSEKFNNGVGGKKYLFEIYSTNEFILRIELQSYILKYEIWVKNRESVFYKVDFKKNVIGQDLEGEKLKQYEILFKKVCGIIKKDRENIKTKFSSPL